MCLFTCKFVLNNVCTYLSVFVKLFLVNLCRSVKLLIFFLTLFSQSPDQTDSENNHFNLTCDYIMNHLIPVMEKREKQIRTELSGEVGNGSGVIEEFLISFYYLSLCVAPPKREALAEFMVFVSKTLKSKLIMCLLPKFIVDVPHLKPSSIVALKVSAQRCLHGRGACMGEVPAWERCLHGRGACMGEVPAWERCLHGRGACMGEVPTWERCLHGRGAYMGEVPAWERCLLGRGACLGEVPAWERCLHGRGACMGEVPAWERCLHGRGACMGEVPAWERCLHGRGACLGEVSLIW